GMPPFSGFWSKDEILTKAFLGHDYGVWAVGMLAALLTGFYMTRLVYLVFFGNARWSKVPVISGGSDDVPAFGERVPAGGVSPTATSEPMIWDPEEPTVAFGSPPRATKLDEHHPPHESPRLMTIPVLVLAALAAIGGLLNVPLHGLEFLTKWLDP